MTQLYKKGNTSWHKLALLGLFSLGATAVQAQFRYVPTSVQNVAGTYTDLGTTGSAIATTNTDDDNSSVQEIGFSFSFNGQEFSQFVLNTNGYLKLGSTAPAAPYFYTGAQDPSSGPMNTASETNLILPFNLDLVSGTTPAEYRVATTGTAPNRVCTIQWKNVSDKAKDGIAAQYDNFSFQAKLYETTNRVEFVYNAPTPVAASADGFKTAAIGLKGSGTAANQAVVMQKTSTGAWSTAFAVAGNYPPSTPASVVAHSVRKSVTPPAGRTYRFNTAFANDARVQTVYSLGKLPIPFAAPHVIQSVVTNAGSETKTNLDVTVTVSGANSFTSTKRVASLAVGASALVSFDAFTPTAEGNNVITVAIPNDEDNSNNSFAFAQQVNTTTFAYAQPGVTPTGALGNGTTATIFAVKYTTPSARSVTAVTARVGNSNTNVGKTLYAVALNSAGTVLARTASFVVTAADLNVDKTYAFDAPVGIAAGEFYVGVVQTASTTAYSPIATQSTELPTRTGAYYFVPLAGGTLSDLGTGNYGAFMIEAVTGGPSTCNAPTSVAVSGATTTTATVSFTGPATATGYTIIYGPRGFDPTSATGAVSVTATTSPVTLTGLTANTFYDVYVRSNCGATNLSILTRPAVFTTLCVPPPAVATFPYLQNFDGVAAIGGALPCGITIADLNNDKSTWSLVSGVAASPSNSMRYTYSETNAADDWFFTPALTLRGGSQYQLSFKLRGPVLQSEKIEVKYGTATTPAAQSTLLYRNEALTNSGEFTEISGSQVAIIRPAADGDYYIGFHAFSNANQFQIHVDDISFSSAITGSSAALMRAVVLFPNPSEGRLSIDVRGANAKAGLQVEVTNMLGQRVHTATIRDNFENRLNLSNLANGMYTVKVRIGNEYMVRNVAIQK